MQPRRLQALETKLRGQTAAAAGWPRRRGSSEVTREFEEDGRSAELTAVATGAGGDGGHGRAGEGRERGGWPRRKRRWRERGFWLRVSGGWWTRGASLSPAAFHRSRCPVHGEKQGPVAAVARGGGTRAADVQLPFDLVDRGLRRHATPNAAGHGGNQPPPPPAAPGVRSGAGAWVWVALEISCVQFGLAGLNRIGTRHLVHREESRPRLPLEPGTIRPWQAQRVQGHSL